MPVEFVFWFNLLIYLLLCERFQHFAKIIQTGFSPIRSSKISAKSCRATWAGVGWGKSCQLNVGTVLTHLPKLKSTKY